MATYEPAGTRQVEVAAPASVVVLRALQLGDLLCAVPAFRAMRHAWPDAELALVGLPWASAFVDRFHYLLDRFIEFPGCTGLPEQPPNPERLEAFIGDLHQQPFELAVQMQGDGTITNDLIRRFGAARAAGFHLPGQAPVEGLFVPYPEQLSEIHRWVLLAAYLGARPRGDHLEFPIAQEDEADAARVMSAAGVRPGEYACLHPGARAEERRWAPQAFARVAESLAGRGLRVIITGSADERGVAEQVRAASRAPLVDLAGSTSLGAAAVVLRGSRLLVCNDTGVSHLAAALKVPSVVFFRTTDPVRWAPLDRRLHRIVIDGGDTLARVVREAGDLLAREARRAS